MNPNSCTRRLLDQNFGMCISPEDILTFYNFYGTNYYRPWKLFSEANKESSSTIDIIEDKMNITLDVQHFRPNEISVKVNDREIFIEGKHEEREDEHGYISRQFIRRYNLPKDCQSETVTSTLSSDGVLIVIVNKNLNTKINENKRVVPIKMTGSCYKKEAESKCEPWSKKEDMSVKFETTNVKDAESSCSKNDSQMMLKEDHCRLLNSDLVSEAVSSTEKLLSESRKETDELLKLISSDTTAKVTERAASEKLGVLFSECKSATAKLNEKASEMTMAFASEVSCSKNSMISEAFESQKTSSSISKSMQSSMTSTSETISEIICADLKEAAESV